MDVYAAVDAGPARRQVERRLRGAVAGRVLHIGRRVAAYPSVRGDGRGVDGFRERHVVARALRGLQLREVARSYHEIANLDPFPVSVRVDLKYGMSGLINWKAQPLNKDFILLPKTSPVNQNDDNCVAVYLVFRCNQGTCAACIDA